MKKGYTTEQARLKAVWEDERIATIVSEMTNITILKDNIAAATDSVKLTGKDVGMLDRLALSNRGFYCKGCMSCESAIGRDGAVPDILRYMMYYNSYGKKDDARRLFSELPEHIKDGIALKDYTSAESACPNGIRIGKAMREAVRILG
jgi:predicted aldo/keto reductase-like oxidoreductase